MKIEFVGFDCEKENSVMHKKIDFEFTVIGDNETDYIELGKVLAKAINKGADFCSVRFIKEEAK